MAQLIKLHDYISRYEMDIYRYPSRFVRMKKQQWEKTKASWENEELGVSNLAFFQPEIKWGNENEKQVLFKKLAGFFKHPQPKENVQGQKMRMTIEEPMRFSASFAIKPATIDELKQKFLDQLYRFQLKWASSTITEQSPIHSKYYFEENLKFFLQRFPDTFLVLYRPVFLLKKALIEAEVILLTPTDAWCITFIEAEDSAVFIGSNQRFWVKRNGKEEKRVLNPLPPLNRTEKIVRNIFKMHEIEFPIHKLIISRNGYIDYPAVPFDVELAEARNFDNWFQTMRALRSPFKNIQLKAAKVLLQYCEINSNKRMDWEAGENDT